MLRVSEMSVIGWELYALGCRVFLLGGEWDAFERCGVGVSGSGSSNGGLGAYKHLEY